METFLEQFHSIAIMWACSEWQDFDRACVYAMSCTKNLVCQGHHHIRQLL